MLLHIQSITKSLRNLTIKKKLEKSSITSHFHHLFWNSPLEYLSSFSKILYRKLKKNLSWLHFELRFLELLDITCERAAEKFSIQPRRTVLLTYHPKSDVWSDTGKCVNLKTFSTLYTCMYLKRDYGLLNLASRYIV